MKVLILEDDDTRIKRFKRKLISHDIYFTKNVEEAKEIYKNLGPFDTIFLDHDLDNRVYVDSNEQNTGYQFAKFLKENNVSCQIIIHSLNAVGVENMKNELPSATVCPFPYLFDD